MGNVTAGYRDLHVHKDTDIALVLIYTHTWHTRWHTLRRQKWDSSASNLWSFLYTSTYSTPKPRREPSKTLHVKSVWSMIINHQLSQSHSAAPTKTKLTGFKARRRHTMKGHADCLNLHTVWFLTSYLSSWDGFLKGSLWFCGHNEDCLLKEKSQNTNRKEMLIVFEYYNLQKRKAKATSYDQN